MGRQGVKTADRTIARIVELRLAGRSNTEIAAAVGIALRSVGRILEDEGFPHSKYGPRPKLKTESSITTKNKPKTERHT